MPASASGVSKQRSSPNSAVSPSVTRKTPPSGPTSSPNTSTAVRGHRVAQGAVERLRHASASVACGHRDASSPRPSSSASSAACSRSCGVGVGVDVGEQVLGVRADVRLRPSRSVRRRSPRRPRRRRRLLVVEQAARAQVGLAAGSAGRGRPRGDLVVGAVAGGVVGVGVGLHAVGVGLDQLGPAAGRGRVRPPRRARPAAPRRRCRRPARPACRSPTPLCASDGAAVCRASGTEIAYLLFCTKNTTGARNTAAKFSASWKSPSLVRAVAAHRHHHGRLARAAGPRGRPRRRAAAGWPAGCLRRDPVLVGS